MQGQGGDCLQKQSPYLYQPFGYYDKAPGHILIAKRVEKHVFYLDTN